MMKKISEKILSMSLLLLMLTTGFYSFAANAPMQQNTQSPADRIEALRIAFISQQLNLTPEEAERFWPVYNTYRKDLDAVRQQIKPVNGELTAEQQLDLEQKKLDLKKKYKPQFEQALGTTKLNALYNIEHKFQEKLKEIREQRMQQRSNIQGRPGGIH